MNWSKTLAEIRSMSIEDRIRMVQAVWDEIAADGAFPGLTEDQERELDRRLTDDKANPDDVIPWETIQAEARARSRQ